MAPDVVGRIALRGGELMPSPSRSRKPEEADYFSTSPISRPVTTPDSEIRDMGGFAWTADGIRVGLGDTGSEWVEEIKRMRLDPDAVDPGFRTDADGNTERE